jgi:hypothetical protein
MFKTNPYFSKADIKGNLVVVLEGSYESRGLTLMSQPSRALLKGEIHELILTDEDVRTGDTVNSISYLGFFEVTEASVAVVGDDVFIKDTFVGKLAGFDDTHMPNHLNIIIKNTKKSTGVQLGFNLQDLVVISKNN